MRTRIIGIDLAVKAAHKAIVLDQASNEFVSKVLTFRTNPAEIAAVVATARQVDGDDEEVRVVAVLEGVWLLSIGKKLEDRRQSENKKKDSGEVSCLPTAQL